MIICSLFIFYHIYIFILNLYKPSTFYISIHLIYCLILISYICLSWAPRGLSILSWSRLELVVDCLYCLDLVLSSSWTVYIVLTSFWARRGLSILYWARFELVVDCLYCLELVILWYLNIFVDEVFQSDEHRITMSSPFTNTLRLIYIAVWFELVSSN